MTTGIPRTSARRRIAFLIVAALALVGAMVLIGFGSASLASLSGELPIDDPTPAEAYAWETGWTLLWSALGATIAAGTALAFAASTFERAQVALSVAGFIACVALVALVAVATWLVTLPAIS